MFRIGLHRLVLIAALFCAAAAGRAESALERARREAAEFAKGDREVAATPTPGAAGNGDKYDLLCDEGVRYENGEGVGVDHAKAFNCYLEAAHGGNRRAMRYVADFYAWGRHVGQSTSRMTYWYHKSAESDDPAGLRMWAWCIDNGFGARQDAAAAAKLYEKAAGFNDAPAMNYIGNKYLVGQGVPRDPGRAFGYFSKGAALGEVNCLTGLGLCQQYGLGTPQDHTAALASYKQAMDKGSTAAVLQTGLICADLGEQDKAVQCYRQAVNLGNAGAMLKLGLCHEYGRGVPQDSARAADLYEQSVKAGGPAEAMLRLANCYETGAGRPQDADKAGACYILAAEAGDVPAMLKAGNYCCTRAGKDYRAAVERYRKAANLGSAEAMNNLGSCYQFGIGVERDYDKALQWYNKGAALGCEQARINYATLKDMLDRQAQEQMMAAAFLTALIVGAIAADSGSDWAPGGGGWSPAVENDDMMRQQWVMRRRKLENAESERDRAKSEYQSSGDEGDRQSLQNAQSEVQRLGGW